MYCNDQDEITKQINNRLRMFKRGIEKEKEYKKYKGGKPYKIKYDHEFHIGVFNGLINTAKNAIDAGYDIPRELSSLLLEHMINRINGDDEWQVITDLQKTDLNNLTYVEHDHYVRSISWIIEGHKEAMRVQQEKPEARFSGKIEDSPFKHPEYDLSAKFYGYKLGFDKTKIYLTDFHNFFLDSSHKEPLDESTVRNKINKSYDLRSLIEPYIAEFNELSVK